MAKKKKKKKKKKHSGELSTEEGHVPTPQNIYFKVKGSLFISATVHFKRVYWPLQGSGGTKMPLVGERREKAVVSLSQCCGRGLARLVWKQRGGGHLPSPGREWGCC